MSITRCPVPQDALLQRYVGQGDTYTDCFTAEAAADVSLPDFVTAFYTTRLFRAERLVLSAILRRRIFDHEIAPFLAGDIDQFAVWRIEAQAEGQLLVCDLWGSTRSWFQIRPTAQGGTQLFFGSAVVVAPDTPQPVLVRISAPLHRLYARLLLNAARRNL